MKDKVFIWNVEMIINRNLYLRKIIDENTYLIVHNQLLKKIKLGK